MNKGSYKAFIVEGASREKGIVENIIRVHFKNTEKYKIITLPAEQNIYMLWKMMKENDFETDIIEEVREYSIMAKQSLTGLTRNDFAEVFLFFDYDGHQRNLSEGEDGEAVLQQILESFDNETENGKLYINYPMVEAVRDFVQGDCKAYTSCKWIISNLTEYKEKTGNNSKNTIINNYDFPKWREVINVFAMRVSCLFGQDVVMSYAEYTKVTPLDIYKRQKRYIELGEIFVLDAFSEFLLDYFSEKFWKKCVKSNSLKNKCGC